MSKNALFVWGGWDGHTPKESVDVFVPLVEEAGYQCTVSDTLDSYLDAELMAGLDVIIPMWTMGEISKDQSKALRETIRAGCGLAGWHGGIIDSFRNDVDYQFMTGGQWVQHPGNCIAEYTVNITDPDHEITKGLRDFVLKGTEQYYCHTDPANHVLCATTFSGKEGEPDLYEAGTVMPYAWTKKWGQGKVFVAAWGHTHADFEVPEAKEIMRRGILWASK